MTFLADENFPKPILNLIRKSGYSVKTIQQKSLQGSSDNTVSSIALKEKRFILTFDKDFLVNQSKNLNTVVFHFPKNPTSEILPHIKVFLDGLEKIKKSKKKIFKFTKLGLEAV